MARADDEQLTSIGYLTWMGALQAPLGGGVQRPPPRKSETQTHPRLGLVHMLATRSPCAAHLEAEELSGDGQARCHGQVVHAPSVGGSTLGRNKDTVEARIPSAVRDP